MQVSSINHGYQAKNNVAFGNNTYEAGAIPRSQKLIIHAGNLAADPVTYMIQMGIQEANKYLELISIEKMTQAFTGLAVLGAMHKTKASTKIASAFDNIFNRAAGLKYVKIATDKVAQKVLNPIEARGTKLLGIAKGKYNEAIGKMQPKNQENLNKAIDEVGKKTMNIANGLHIGSKQQIKETVAAGAVALLASEEARDQMVKQIDMVETTPVEVI